MITGSQRLHAVVLQDAKTYTLSWTEFQAAMSLCPGLQSLPTRAAHLDPKPMPCL